MRAPDGTLDLNAARHLPPKYQDRIIGPPLGMG
jgi:hypothetical protein